jgi:hypothetical protein
MEGSGCGLMEGIKKTTRFLIQDSRCLYRHSNRAPVEHDLLRSVHVKKIDSLCELCSQIGTTAGLHAGGMSSNTGPEVLYRE